MTRGGPALASAEAPGGQATPCAQSASWCQPGSPVGAQCGGSVLAHYMAGLGPVDLRPAFWPSGCTP